MKASFLAFHVYRYLAVVSLSIGLEACATDTTTFLNYGNPRSNVALPPREQLMAAPAVSDGLAINYANSVEIIMRCKATQNRITREVSSTAQIGLAAFGGVGAALNWSKTTLTILGLGSAAMPELQKIFDAKGRAEAYNQAAEMIQDGVLEYYAHNSAPSPAEFTPNGLTLVKKVGSAINLVNDTINGHLPSQADMKRATEQMTPKGTEIQNPSESPVNERIQTDANVKVHVIDTVSRTEFQTLKEQVDSEIKKGPGDVGFVTALTQIDRDTSIANKQSIYEAIIAEAGITGKVTPDTNALNTFYQTTASANERKKLTAAANKHVKK